MLYPCWNISSSALELSHRETLSTWEQSTKPVSRRWTSGAIACYIEIRARENQPEARRTEQRRERPATSKIHVDAFSLPSSPSLHTVCPFIAVEIFPIVARSLLVVVALMVVVVVSTITDTVFTPRVQRRRRRETTTTDSLRLCTRNKCR